MVPLDWLRALVPGTAPFTHFYATFAALRIVRRCTSPPWSASSSSCASTEELDLVLHQERLTGTSKSVDLADPRRGPYLIITVSRAVVHQLRVQIGRIALCRSTRDEARKIQNRCHMRCGCRRCGPSRS